MREYFRGFSSIFSFTFKQHVKNSKYMKSTIIIALLCLIIPAVIMIGIEAFSDEPEAIPELEYEAGFEEGIYQEPTVDMIALEKLYLVDISEEKYESAGLNKGGLEASFTQAFGIVVDVIDCGDDLEKAQKATRGTDNALILLTEQNGQQYNFITLIPEGSTIDENIAYNFDTLISGFVEVMYAMESGFDPYAEGDNFSGEEEYEEMTEDEMAEVEAESTKELVSMIVMYLNIMLLYFFVLVYGQGVANSVVMEKSSKLMESMLVAVNPVAIILGKLFAITLTGVIQIISWIGSLGLSFVIGTYGVKAINPESTMEIIEVFKLLRELTEGMFSPLNCVIAAVIIMLGMLLYCSLAGVGGAMASKAEDLSSANMLFTLVLVISFLATIYGGGMEGTSNPIMDWIPFTAVMVTPANALLGNIPIWQGLAIIAIILATTVAITWVAGRVYKSLVFYRGDALKPSYILKVLKGKN